MIRELSWVDPLYLIFALRWTVAITLLAREELSIAWSMPEISLRNPSLAMRPAGSSAPRLIRSPLLSRRSVSAIVFCDLASPRWAVNDATLVLIRAMSILHDCYGGRALE